MVPLEITPCGAVFFYIKKGFGMKSELTNEMINSIEVLENFDMYMEKVPEWLRDYFIKVFRNMNYDLSFSTYYDENFTGKIKKDVEKAFSEYNLTDKQYEKIYKILMKDTNKRIKEGVKNV